MNNKISSLLDGLITYDYILFGGIFLVFVLLIVLSIIFRNKTKLSIFLAIFSFIFLITAPFIGYSIMHNILFKNQTVLTSQKKLEFTNAVVVYAKLTNLSSRDFESCVITASIHRSSSNSLKNYIYKFKPLQKMSIIEEDIVIGNEINFKIIVSPFTYSGDFNTILEASCR